MLSDVRKFGNLTTDMQNEHNTINIARSATSTLTVRLRGLLPFRGCSIPLPKISLNQNIELVPRIQNKAIIK